CVVSRRPARPWSAGAAAPPPRTSRRRRRTSPICRCRARAPPHGRDRPGLPAAGRARARRGGPPASPPPGPPPRASSAPPSATPAEPVTALREHGLDLFAVTSPEDPRAHRDSLGMAVHLQAHGRVETIVTMTTWDKTIMTLQADLLGAHALGIRSVVCETGNPPVLGDYPAVDGIWEVDSPGLVGLR